jgi:hypothetical protein
MSLEGQGFFGQIIDDALQLQSRAELDACKLATKGGTTL